MIRVTVAQTTIRTIPYTDKKGVEQKLYVQNAYAHTVDDQGNAPIYPEKFEIVLPRGQIEGYPVGEYQLAPSAIYVDRQGKLGINARLKPMQAAPAVRPAASHQTAAVGIAR